jgi:hypothetical protein
VSVGEPEVAGWIVESPFILAVRGKAESLVEGSGLQGLHGKQGIDGY